MNTKTAQQVYAYHAAYFRANRYAPTVAEAYHALGISNRTYYAAFKWLLERRFLTRQGRCWRNVRVNVRTCPCGAEIAPANAVIGVDGKGYRYVRRVCDPCWRHQHSDSQRRFAKANPGYYLRINQRIRQRQGASA